jgi:hypothetical protein
MALPFCAGAGLLLSSLRRTFNANVTTEGPYLQQKARMIGFAAKAYSLMCLFHVKRNRALRMCKGKTSIRFTCFLRGAARSCLTG